MGTIDKPASFLRAFFSLLLGLMTLTFSALAANTPSSSPPAIKTVRTVGKKVVITAQVPLGTRQAILESHAAGEKGGWKPRAVRHLNGKTRQLVFQLPNSGPQQEFRITVPAQTLPAAFYRGKTAFAPLPAGFAQSESGGLVTPGGALMSASTISDNPDSNTSAVVESDIWKVCQNWLYFYNQYRGLQVMDISQPDNAALVASLDLPAVGEQLYVLDPSHVILLAQNPADENAGKESQILLVDLTQNPPAVTTNFFLGGYIAESRMIGSGLYVACDLFQAGTNGDYQSTTVVSSFDFSSFSAPGIGQTVSLSGYPSAITATDRYFFVATQNGDCDQGSQLACIDLAPSEKCIIRLVATIPIAGWVPDKFKIDLSGDVLSVISQKARSSVLETFSFTDPTAPVALGRLKFGCGEALGASRFDSGRAYVTTGERIDPLWIIDLSDPTNPQIAGQLSFRGSESFIYPMGTRLITIGQGTGWRARVSLFDVSDPANPALLSKVKLGDDWSWSEANFDEKAFNVLPDQGLILVPFQGDSATNGFVNSVQLIDLATNALTLRGTIDHSMLPRRATFVNNRIISISEKELLSVDATDRDNPVVRKELPLAWPVNQVLLSGDYLLELSWSGTAQCSPALRVTLASTPDQLVSQWTLGDLPVLGATVLSNKLYVLQGQSVWWWPPIVFQPLCDSPDQTNQQNLRFSIIDLTQLPDLQYSAQTDIQVTNVIPDQLKAIWPKPGVLAWVGASQQLYGWPIVWSPGVAQPLLSQPISQKEEHGTLLAPLSGVTVSGSTDATTAIVFPPGYNPWPLNGYGAQILAFDVSNDTSPSLLSSVSLAADSRFDNNRVFTTNGLIYLSHAQLNQSSRRFLPTHVLRVSPTPATPAAPQPAPPTRIIRTAPTTNAVIYMQPVTRKSVTALGTSKVPAASLAAGTESHYLDVVDYSDPASPTVRDPVSISGPLIGLARNGEVIFTLSRKGHAASCVDALAYDGVQASLAASLPIGTNCFPAVAIVDETCFIGAGNKLQAWTFTDAAKCSQLGSLTFSAPILSLQGLSNLLIVRSGNTTIQLVDPNPHALSVVGSGSLNAWLGYDLHQSDGALDRGLWIPRGDYGVQQINITPQK